MTRTSEDYESRSEGIADRTRFHLAALHTGGIATTFAIAGALAAKDVAPSWNFWPVLIFAAGLVVTAASLLLAKHMALKRRDANRKTESESDFSSWYWRHFSYEIAATVLFLVAVLVGLVTLRILSLPGT